VAKSFHVLLYKFQLAKLSFPNVKNEVITSREELEKAISLKKPDLLVCLDIEADSIIDFNEKIKIAILMDQVHASTTREWIASGVTNVWLKDNWIESLIAEYNIELAPPAAPKMETVSDYRKTIVIAVGSVSKGIGSTHTSLLLANYLARHVKTTVGVWETGDNPCFDYLDHYLNGSISASRLRFDQKNVTLFKNRVTYQQMRSISEFSYHILDLGYVSKENEERNNWFIEADVPILVGSGSEWRLGEILSYCMQNIEVPQDRWRIALPLAADQAVDALRSVLAGRPVFNIPDHKNPFGGQQDTDEVIESILSPILPKKQKKNLFGFLK